MTVIDINTLNAHEVAVELGALSKAVAVQVPGIVRHFGQLYQTKVRAAASGRPGPRAITGDYRRSITLEMSAGIHVGSGAGEGDFNRSGQFFGSGFDVVAIVGTTSPQGRRLEFGYVDTDSLGRHYSQPPFEHFGPPLPAIEEAMEKALLGMVDFDQRLQRGISGSAA